MIDRQTLTLFYGGIVAFTKDVTVDYSSEDKEVFAKYSERVITPHLVYLFESGRIPADSFKLVLRKVNQLEDHELIELSEIAAPRNMFPPGHIRVVQRDFDREKNKFVARVELHRTQSGTNVATYFLISGNGNMSILTHDPGNLSQDYSPYVNQGECFRWLLNKSIDVFGLIDNKIAAGRTKWDSTGFERSSFILKKTHNG